jgi:hypothetical protein
LKDKIEEKINKKEEDWVVGGWNWKKNSITKRFKKINWATRVNLPKSSR